MTSGVPLHSTFPQEDSLKRSFFTFAEWMLAPLLASARAEAAFKDDASILPALDAFIDISPSAIPLNSSVAPLLTVVITGEGLSLSESFPEEPLDISTFKPLMATTSVRVTELPLEASIPMRSACAD